MVFYSEYGEDRWLYERGFLSDKGIYVDIGAAWPKDYSNTAMVRDMGWEGIQVDANPVFKPLWNDLGLELVVAVVWTGSQANYIYNSEKPNLSKISPEGSPVEAITLNEILSSRRIEKIDLLTVDVEGAEFSILSTLDFKRHRPHIIIWEYNTLGVKNESLNPFLGDQGYRCVHQTECNYIHVDSSL